MTHFLTFAVTAVTIVVLLIHFRVTRKITKKRAWRVAAFVVSVLIAYSFIWAICGRNHIQPVDGAYDLVTIGFYVMTVVAVLVCLVILRDIVLGIWNMIMVLHSAKRHHREVHDSLTDLEIVKADKTLVQDVESVETRRDFLMRVSSWGVLGATAVASVPAVYSAKCRRTIRRTTIQFAKLPQAFDGMRIAHLSDIHVGNTITQNDVIDIVNETNALEPDMIVITGDIADGNPAYQADDLSPMRNLKAKYGVFYVTGNHEHGWGARGYCKAVAELGFVVLNNENRLIDVGGEQIAVAGVIDYSGDRRERKWKSDPAAALHGLPESIFKIMLAHQPASVDDSLKHGADLVLAGHTHGGQFWPACYLVDAIFKYSRGLYQMGQKAVFVSCGTGYWGPPLRLGVPCEICLHTLKRET